MDSIGLEPAPRRWKTGAPPDSWINVAPIQRDVNVSETWASANLEVSSDLGEERPTRAARRTAESRSGTKFRIVFQHTEDRYQESRHSPERDNSLKNRLFDGRQIARAVGVSGRQLDYWIRSGVIEPTMGANLNSSLFTFGEAVLTACTNKLKSSGISLARIRDLRPLLAETIASKPGKDETLVITDDRSVVTADGAEIWEAFLTGTATVAIPIDAIRSNLELALDSRRDTALENSPSRSRAMVILSSQLSFFDPGTMQDTRRTPSEVWNSALGPFHTSETAERHLGVSRAQLAEMVGERLLLRLITADGISVYPGFQFVDGGRILPGLDSVLSQLGAVADDWTISGWLAAKRTELTDRSVVEALTTEENIEPVLRLAVRTRSSWSR